MLRFRRFKASLNFNSGKPSEIDHFDKSPGISLNGAYRTNKDELFGSDLYPASPKKITPSMVKLPTQSGQTVHQSKSTNNLARPANEKADTSKSAPDIPQAVNQLTKVNSKEQKKLEKQRLAEQKKQEKLAEKERQREEKLRKEREKLIAQQTKAVEQRPKKDQQSKTKKRAAPQPQQAETQNTAASNAKQREQYSTNTLESSISKSSGPPPYSLESEVSSTRIGQTEKTSNSKPAADMDSWELNIFQHRQQMNRQAGTGKSASKQKILDLQYNAGSTKSNENKNSNA